MFPGPTGILPSLIRCGVAAMVLSGFFAGTHTLVAQATAPAEGDDLGALYRSGYQAFDAGQFADAAAKLQKLVSLVGDDAKLEEVYYTIAAAHFNLKDYPKAIAAFELFLKKFPKAVRGVDARFAIAQCHLLNKNFAEAARLFKDLEAIPALRDRALFLNGSAQNQAGNLGEAATAFERLITPKIATPLQMRGAQILVEIYSKRNEPDKAVALLRTIQKRIVLAENVVNLNSLAVQLGDAFLKAGRNANALDCYRMVRLPDQVIALQEDRIRAMNERIEGLKELQRGNPQQALANRPVIEQIEKDITSSTALLEQFRKLPNYIPAMYLRMGQCFYQLNRKWEAIVLYRDILDRWPADPAREQAMYALLVTYAEVGRAETALRYCRIFLKEFPTSKHAGTVGYLTGAAALQAEDPAAAETYFGTMLRSGGEGAFKQEMQFLLGNAQMMQGKNEQAVQSYKQYLKQHPTGPHADEAGYRIALATMLQGKYGEAVAQLRSYISANPSGTYVADAEYRLIIAKYAENDFKGAIALANAWEEKRPRDEQLGEVLSLKADALAAIQQDAESADTYARAAKAATTDEVLGYAIFEANKAYQRLREWDKVIALWNDVLKNRRNSPLVVAAVYWIAGAQSKQGKEDEAKRFVARTVAEHIGDPDREAVEQLLTQLAQLCAKKKRPRDADGNFIDPSTLPPAPDPAVEMEELLKPAVQRMAALAGSTSSAPSSDDAALAAAAFGGVAPTNAPAPVISFNENTAKARILYAKSELAAFKRQQPESDRLLEQITKEYKPEDLSPMLLGKLGDYLLGRGRTNAARAYYTTLRTEFPKAMVVDFAYAGLGRIACDSGDYKTTLVLCDEAAEKGVIGLKTRELDILRAQALAGLQRHEEARKAFEAIASNKEYRGEATALAVFNLGEVARAQGQVAEANAFYQRVYVAYRKFLPWVAKAYLRSGELFEKVGDQPAALRTYREMQRNEKLQPFPEYAEAVKRADALAARGVKAAPEPEPAP